MPTYTYHGNAGFIDEVQPRLEAAGFTREGEVEVADFAVLFCPSMSELEDIYFGDEGIVQKMAPGATIVDLSPTTPNFAKEANAIATLSSLSVVEAPLSVKNMYLEKAFEHDNLICFAAGDESAIANASAFLDAIFSKVLYVGEAGNAQLAHAATTLQRVAELIAAIEYNALFKACGSAVSRAVINSVEVQDSSSDAYCVLKAASEERFRGSFTCEMLYADLVAALQAADDNELIMPQAEAASHLLELISVIGGADYSPAALSLVYDSEEKCAKHGLDWSRAQVFYGEVEQDSDDLADGFGSFDDYGEYEDFSDDPYGEDTGIGFGYSSN